MKIWFVVTIFGHISAVYGPLPYNMAECQSRLQEKNIELDQSFIKNPEPGDVNGHKVKREDIQFSCVQQEKRPALDEE